MVDKEILQFWNDRLAKDGMGLIEESNGIFPEVIDLTKYSNQLEILYKIRVKAVVWLVFFKEDQLEKIRYGKNKGKPNFIHKTVIELFAKGLSTRQISKQLRSKRSPLGHQGVARVITRYLGA